MNSELMLEEPLSVASVITFGIEGGCILVELIVNASIDDIYGNNYNTHLLYCLHIASYLLSQAHVWFLKIVFVRTCVCVCACVCVCVCTHVCVHMCV